MLHVAVLFRLIEHPKNHKIWSFGWSNTTQASYMTRHNWTAADPPAGHATHENVTKHAERSSKHLDLFIFAYSQTWSGPKISSKGHPSTLISFFFCILQREVKQKISCRWSFLLVVVNQILVFIWSSFAIHHGPLTHPAGSLALPTGSNYGVVTDPTDGNTTDATTKPAHRLPLSCLSVQQEVMDFIPTPIACLSCLWLWKGDAL